MKETGIFLSIGLALLSIAVIIQGIGAIDQLSRLDRLTARVDRLAAEQASAWCLRPRVHPLTRVEYLSCVNRVKI